MQPRVKRQKHRTPQFNRKIASFTLPTVQITNYSFLKAISPHTPPPKKNRIEKKNDNKKGLLFLYTQICNVPFLRVVLSPSCLSCGSIEC